MYQGVFQKQLLHTWLKIKFLCAFELIHIEVNYTKIVTGFTIQQQWHVQIFEIQA